MLLKEKIPWFIGFDWFKLLTKEFKKLCSCSSGRPGALGVMAGGVPCCDDGKVVPSVEAWAVLWVLWIIRYKFKILI